MTRPAAITVAQLRVLKRAAKRRDGSLLPIVDVSGDALRMLQEALIRRGYVTDDSHPTITDAGRNAVETICPRPS